MLTPRGSRLTTAGRQRRIFVVGCCPWTWELWSRPSSPVGCVDLDQCVSFGMLIRVLFLPDWRSLDSSARRMLNESLPICGLGTDQRDQYQRFSLEAATHGETKGLSINKCYITEAVGAIV
jgi:hypothetical protein